MSQRHVRALSLVVFTLIAVAAVRGQDPSFTVRVDVNLVTLDVGVTDSSGKAVTNLTRDDFQIFENGQRQQIGSFASVDTPYNVLMLFDCSGSTEPSWPFLVEAVNRFAAGLRPQDGLFMAQFGSDFKKLLDWSVRTGKPMDVRIQTTDRSCSGTDLYGAVESALDQFKTRKGRRGVVALTDGQHAAIPRDRDSGRLVDSGDDKDFQKLLRSVRSGDVVLYFVAVNSDLNPGVAPYNPSVIHDLQQARSRMEQLAAASGGRVSYPKIPGDVVRLYEQIAQELGTSYGLGYTPSNGAKDGKPRKIEVRVKDPSMKVRQSRETYEPR